MTTPDLLEPITGYRVWRLIEHDEGLRLRGWNGLVWSHRQPTEAQCTIGRDHDALKEGCTCGLYAFS